MAINTSISLYILYARGKNPGSDYSQVLLHGLSSLARGEEGFVCHTQLRKRMHIQSDLQIDLCNQKKERLQGQSLSIPAT